MVAAEVSVSLTDLEKLLLEVKVQKQLLHRVSNSVRKLCLDDAEALTLQRLIEPTKFISMSKVI